MNGVRPHHLWWGMALTVIAAPACGQCTPQWLGYGPVYLDANVWCVTSWDPDGAGPRTPVVVAGGNMQHAGSTLTKFVAKWDGNTWQPMGEGVNGTVATATQYDFNRDGLFEPVIGGYFDASGSITLNGVGVYIDGQWSALGSGVTASAVPAVFAASAYQDSLVIGGGFSYAGGVPVQGLARWENQTWHAFQDERAAGPNTLTVVGASLYAVGYFALPGGMPTDRTAILKWTDPLWVNVGSNAPRDDGWTLASYRGQLILGGDFTNECCGNPSSPGEHIAMFDGTSWQPMGTGINGPVDALCVFDPDGPGPMPELLIAGGNFNTAGGQPASGIAAWDGTSWSGLGPGTTGQVRALAVWNNQLVVAGDFFSAGGIVSPGMALWGCPLQLPCYPNCDASTAAPVLNVADFVCFANRFAAADPGANCDGSTAAPVLNVADFVCFVNRFAAGCL